MIEDIQIFKISCYAKEFDTEMKNFLNSLTSIEEKVLFELKKLFKIDIAGDCNRKWWVFQIQSYSQRYFWVCWDF